MNLENVVRRELGRATLQGLLQMPKIDSDTREKGDTHI